VLAGPRPRVRTDASCRVRSQRIIFYKRNLNPRPASTTRLRSRPGEPERSQLSKQIIKQTNATSQLSLPKTLQPKRMNLAIEWRGCQWNLAINRCISWPKKLCTLLRNRLHTASSASFGRQPDLAARPQFDTRLRRLIKSIVGRGDNCFR